MEKENERLFHAREEPDKNEGRPFEAREKDAGKYAASKLRFEGAESRKAEKKAEETDKKRSGDRSAGKRAESRQRRAKNRTPEREADKKPENVYSKKFYEKGRIRARVLHSADTAGRQLSEAAYQEAEENSGQDISGRTAYLAGNLSGRAAAFGADRVRESLRSGRYRRMFLERERPEDRAARDAAEKAVFREEGQSVFTGTGKAADVSGREGSFRQIFSVRNDIPEAETVSNPLSRWRQKKKAQQASYERSRRSFMEAAGGIAGTAGKAGERFSVRNIAEALRKTSGAVVTAGIILIGLLSVISISLSSCTAFLETGSGVVMSASFTAEEQELRAVEDRYRGLEAALRRDLGSLRDRYPGYDVYRIEGGEVGHNAYELAALLTVLYEDYTEEEVREILRRIFEEQYEVTYRTSTETTTRTRTVRVGESLGQVVTSGYCNCALCCGPWAGGATASGVMPQAAHTIAVDKYDPLLPFGTHVIMNGTEYVVEDTGPLNRYGVTFDVYYDDHATAQAHGHQTWEAFLADDNGSGSVEITETVTEKILTAAVKNEGIAAAMGGFHLTDLQRARYELLLETKGNREGVFPPDIYTDLSEGEYTDYRVPPEALSDTAFAGMLREAERYLGLPYVWGGSSPETGFDCSGFVSWVINHSGNGWNVRRQTAEGLRQACAYVPPSEARPGDLVFFRGTYDTAGASHVGIYVGNGMMIHCGHPVQYASIETDYWRAHFYQYGRIG